MSHDSAPEDQGRLSPNPPLISMSRCTSPGSLTFISPHLRRQHARLSPLSQSKGLPPITPPPEDFQPRDPINLATNFGVGNNAMFDLLAGLNINNKPIQELVISNAASIAQLQTEGRRYKKDLAKLKELLALSADVRKIQMTMQADAMQLQQDLSQI
ncbi:hypothetical protein PCANC_16771 [Puccinia coronata f. sp. avenae]|uniref:REM-1 domain-containing protein n=1 Tax=Puccinia coronata f. sp. avenae TaxID=200324 RepID=A0A2N5US08_9BASI|nr:hypothetical protein PCANC_16771 [Puccinia coronata f. sp. avenae]